MYTKMTLEELRNNNIGLYIFTVHDTELACNILGHMYRKMKSGNWKEIINKKNHAKGYNVVLISKNQYSRSKLILYAQNKITLEDKNTNIYHINKNRLDCHMDNLTFDVINTKKIR